MIPETIKTRGLHAGVRFAPPANLDKQHKQQFQMKANEGFDWQRQEYTERVWRLATPQANGDPRSHLKLTLQPDAVNFEDSFPTGPMEVFFDNLKLALDAVAAVFNPRLILGIGAVVRLSSQSDPEDARVFLGGQCLKIDERLSSLGRPVHGMGIKLLLPPLPGEGKPNWQAIVRVESLLEDVRQLFIEVDARWGTPSQWNPQTAVDSVKTAHDFATGQVVQFLKDLSRPF